MAINTLSALKERGNFLSSSPLPPCRWLKSLYYALCELEPVRWNKIVLVGEDERTSSLYFWMLHTVFDYRRQQGYLYILHGRSTHWMVSRWQKFRFIKNIQVFYRGYRYASLAHSTTLANYKGEPEQEDHTKEAMAKARSSLLRNEYTLCLPLRLAKWAVAQYVQAGPNFFPAPQHIYVLSFRLSPAIASSFFPDFLWGEVLLCLVSSRINFFPFLFSEIALLTFIFDLL